MPPTPPLRPHWLANDTAYRTLGDLVPGLFGCGFQLKPHLGWDFRNRMATEYSAVLVLRGTGTYRDHAGRIWPLAPGTLLQRFTTRRHSHHITPDGTWAECWIALGHDMERMLLALGLVDPDRPVRIVGIIPALVERIARQRDALRAAPPSSLPRHIWGLVDILLALLETDAPVDATARHPQRRHDKAIDAACQRLAREPATALAVLARDAGLSSERFRKVFQRQVGSSVARFRVRCRMDVARERLHDPAASIQAIARELGYASANAFSACFRRETGRAPRDFRT